MAKKKSKQTAKRKKFKDEQKDKRIFEHITIKEDIITEDDIRNVITDIKIAYGEIQEEKDENDGIQEK